MLMTFYRINSSIFYPEEQTVLKSGVKHHKPNQTKHIQIVIYVQLPMTLQCIHTKT